MIKILNAILNFSILTALSLMAASLFKRTFNLEFWWSAIFLGVIAFILYVSGVLLMKYYLEKNAPGVLDLDAAYGKPMRDGEYLWEKTAGTGVVPKWVSWIGMAAFACVAGITIWMITWLMN